jgi:hypothetical protein
MIPRYGEWERRYRAKGLSVVGVHTPETEQEADVRAIENYVKYENIAWRVVLDPYHEVWRRYGAQAWPTLLLVDRRGVVRRVYVGEGRAAEIEAEIRRLLAEA